MTKFCLRTFTLVALVLAALGAHAEVIEFPEEELGRESVLPRFDQPDSVKKKLVPFSERFEIEGFLGASLNDPFYNIYPIGAKGTYHFTDIHSAGLLASVNITNPTSYVGQIQSQVSGGNFIPFANAPVAQYFLLGEYEFTPYYGKISLTKQNVMNLTISGSLGGGMVGTSSGTGNDSSLAFSVGLNERFFFTRNFGIKTHLRTLFYQQNDIVPLSVSKKNVVNLMLTVGAVYFIPSL